MTAPAPVALTGGSAEADAPLVVLLHGRGSNEADIAGLIQYLPGQASYAALRAPLGEHGGYAWFANRGIGRPLPESLRETMDWFHGWLDSVAEPGRRVILVGFSGGAAFAGGLVLDRPDRFAGAGILYGTLPFEAGVPVTPGRLSGSRALVIQGEADTVIPRDLLDRTWDYLTDPSQSGADTTAVRLPGGHGISAAALAQLQTWLGGLIEDVSGSAS
jgi:phospholipase/carboxylesterase